MDALVELWHNWAVGTDDPNNLVRILFPDYMKGFDHIDHTILLRKMAQLGLPLYVVRWLTGFLCERQQRVPMGGLTSDWLRVLCGVLQGTRTGPIAFLFMINDLLSNRNHAKFVDDTTVWELCEGRGATSEMAAIAAETEAWSAVNNTVLNGDKTKQMAIHFGRTGADIGPVLIDNTVVEQVTSFKLLGCTVNNQLSWQDHVDCIYAKASRGLYFLCLLRRAAVKSHDIVRVFTSAVRSILEHACANWHTCLTALPKPEVQYSQN